MRSSLEPRSDFFFRFTDQCTKLPDLRSIPNAS
ncbi:hypothetical protein P7_143 [Pectobacterium phage vB_PcaM_P7_Pc]|nr:hypothetical protein P7_143 [Pectobacterium phage vB_PcaM_P7_Pc]